MIDTRKFHNLLTGWSTMDESLLKQSVVTALYHDIQKFFTEDREAATQSYMIWRMQNPEARLC
jgi:hypothetical protein